MSKQSKPSSMMLERRFAPFFGTQFLGALNDNLLKNVLVLLVTFNTTQFTQLNSGLLSNIAAGLFILPFVLFSAAAGNISDRADKAQLIKIIKAAEVVIMLIAGFGLYVSNMSTLLFALFLMGVHSAFFGPIKYSILPQVLNDNELVTGNAWVEMGTFLAILLGTIAAGFLVSSATPMPLIVCTWLGVALLGLWFSVYIPATKAIETQPAALTLKLGDFGIKATASLIHLAQKKRAVWLSVLGISWFWLIGSVVLAQLPALVKYVVHADAVGVTGLLALFSIGIGVGSLLCERMSDHQVEIGLVPFGSIGISLFALDIWWACEHTPHLANVAGLPWLELWQQALYKRLAIDFGLLGIFSGFFIVPLYSLIQLRTPKDETSRVIAANNILNAVFMVAGAGFAATVLALGWSVPQIILVIALLNAAVAAYIYTLLPEFLWRFIVWILVHTIYRVQKQGLEYVPREGRAVLICNHISFADAVVIAAVIRRPIRFVMDYKIFANPVLGWFFRTSKTIPIAPFKADPDIYEHAFETIKHTLQEDELICIFPEGKISTHGEMNEFKNGILRIMQENPDTPIIPMALSGLWGSTFSRRHSSLLKRLNLGEFLRTIRLNIGASINDERCHSPEQLREEVLKLRGNWL